jgi:6-pyruvoyltetrahydropterin/6-carboxytetrahydropterin synthase
MAGYKYEIQKEFHFSASHQLTHLPDGHQCARLHGHNYIVVVVLGSNELNEDGFVKDYGELKPLKKYIDTMLDHRHLNDVFSFHTTAENMSKHIYTLCKERFGWEEVVEVRFSETPKTWARYRGEVNE